MKQIDIKKGLAALDNAICSAPETPGVYKMLDSAGVVIYIGKAKNIRKRLSQYKRIDKMPNRLRLMITLLHAIDTLVTDNESDALILEANLIKSFDPRFNIALRDDKSFPYIAIYFNHEFPRIAKHRGAKNIQTRYYGPFSSVENLEATINELQKIFMIRSCTDNYFTARRSQMRPCLLYQIKRCSAPCVNKITQKDYAQSIDQVIDFLSGNSKNVQNELIDLMNTASTKLDFERAAVLRDRIALLTQMQKKRIMLDYKNDAEIHIFAHYRNALNACLHLIFMRNGKNYQNQQYFLKDVDTRDYHNSINIFILQLYEDIEMPQEIWINTEEAEATILQNALISLAKRKNKGNIYYPKVVIPKLASLEHNIMEFATKNARHALINQMQKYSKQHAMLQRMQEVFVLQRIPERIEVYDNSHIFGKFSFGCMIVATPDGFDKREYRKFKIEHDTNSDDYYILNQTLSRRLKHLQSAACPDVILIDGGAGHLAVAIKILELNKLDQEIDVISIAKGEKRNAGEEWFFTPKKGKFQLEKNDPLLFYLQNLRDEAHRFAISTHRKARTKATLKSLISDVPGVGEKRMKTLLTIFGSYERITSASIEELSCIKAIGKKTAEKIVNICKQRNL